MREDAPTNWKGLGYPGPPSPDHQESSKAFLDLVGHYRHFIHNFASVAVPLMEHLAKGWPQQVHWTPDCEMAFQILKDRLSQESILYSPNFTHGFMVQTDVLAGLGAVLSKLLMERSTWSCALAESCFHESETILPSRRRP